MEDGRETTAADADASRPLISEDAGSDSSVTLVLVITTFIVLSGSFANGCSIDVSMLTLSNIVNIESSINIMAYTSPAESGIKTELGLSDSQYAIFGSIFTAGSVISSLISGKTADLIGRKKTMWLSQTFFALGWLAIIFAENALSLYCGRFSIGLGVGFVLFVVPVHMAEVAPKNLRGSLTACFQLTNCLGFSLIFIVGNFVSWRVLAGIGSVPCCIQIIGLYAIPESPRWLAKVGREGDVKVSLQRLRGKGVDVSVEEQEIEEYTRTCKAFAGSQNNLAELFQRKYAQPLLVGAGLMVVQQFGGANALSTYASDVFEYADFSTTIGTTGVALIQIPATILSSFLMDIWGRRPLAMLSTAGMCASCFIVGFSFLLQDFNVGTEFTPVAVFIGFMMYNSFFAVGMGIIPFVLMSEIFPINVKGLAGSFVILVCSFCAFITVYLFPFALAWSSAGIFFIFFASCGAGLLFMLKFLPETKCRTLEQIQESMVHFL